MAMTDEDVWAAYLALATSLKEGADPGAPVQGVVGRSVTDWVDRLVDFWNDHKDTLIPVLTNLAIAALEALAAQRASIDTINKPGPQ